MQYQRERLWLSDWQLPPTYVTEPFPFSLPLPARLLQNLNIILIVPFVPSYGGIDLVQLPLQFLQFFSLDNGGIGSKGIYSKTVLFIPLSRL